MNGLDSIALVAVAQLEELSSKTQQSQPQDAKDAKNHSSSSLTASSAATTQNSTTPCPQPFSMIPSSRVVSSDSISSTCAGEQKQVEIGRLVVGSAGPTSEAAISESNDQLQDFRKQQQPKPQHPTTTSIASQEAKAPVAPGTAEPNRGRNNLAQILANPAAWLSATEHEAGKALSEAPPKGAVIEQILQDDVLCGRGGESNHHPGNQQYRRLVKAFQPLYIASKRRDKPRIAQCIVYTIRTYGGRFLKRTTSSDKGGKPQPCFEDVGNTKAREKTSQALREGAPELRGTNPSSNGAVAAGAPTENTGPEPVASVSGGASAGNGASSMAPASRTGVPASADLINPRFGHPAFHPQGGPHSSSSFGHAFNPHQNIMFGSLMQQMLMSAPTSGSLNGVPPGHPLSSSDVNAASVPATAAAAMTAIAHHGFVDRKRPYPQVVSSESSSSSFSEDSSSTSSTTEGVERKRPRGPRLKRLKHRLQQEQEVATTTEDAHNN